MPPDLSPHPKTVSALQAVERIQPGERVYLATGAAVPGAIVQAIVESPRLAPDIEVVQLFTLGDAPYLGRPGLRSSVFFVARNSRDAVNSQATSFFPAHLSELPALMRHGPLAPDVVAVSVTPPDPHGFVSLGPSVDLSLAAMEPARLIIGQVNRFLPRTRGAALLPVQRFHLLVAADAPLPEYQEQSDPRIVADARKIGAILADLVPKEATIQCGIGSWIGHSLRMLASHKSLSIHTELFSDGLTSLVTAGTAVSGTASFAIGSAELYRFIGTPDGPEFEPSDDVCSPKRIAAIPKMTSINTALEIDLTGQVCADSLGGYFYSGPGGFSDFQRGAALSPGGCPIIALRSTAIGGRHSRIVPSLAAGAGLAAARADIHWIVTEWGAANLHGKSIRDRALALTELAHPDFRRELMNTARERRLVYVKDQLPAGTERRYPHELIEKVLLKDGSTVRIRPLRQSDEERLRELFYSGSENSIYRRFHTALRSFPSDRLRLFFDQDYHSRLSLGVYETEDSDEALIGLASYALDRKSRFAEMAVLVRDDRQKLGLGPILTERLIRIARSKGFKGLTAYIQADNRPMMRLVETSGLPFRKELSSGIYEVWMPFAPEPPAKETRG
ncbi:MAG: GNAT family N-acetyltransferase [Deltaproteobacteria bacterium]|nr:GNAT family N-acetyltransferase [Deltaproteobacteria bacterium]